MRKGYAPAVQGQRAARPVTRRQVTSAPSTARSTAPVLWRFRTGASAFGIHVGDDRCWAEPADFADSVRTGRTPSVTGEDARGALAVALAAIESVAGGGTVRVDQVVDV